MRQVQTETASPREGIRPFTAGVEEVAAAPQLLPVSEKKRTVKVFFVTTGTRAQFLITVELAFVPSHDVDSDLCISFVSYCKCGLAVCGGQKT